MRTCLLLTFLSLFSTMPNALVPSSSSLRMTMTSGAWLPVAAKSALPTSLPVAVEVAGERLVVWKTASSDFVVGRDVCPHRLAPLSQGRVDPLTSCIECPYHGQQFSADGTCTRIPQLEAGSQIPRANDATTFRTHSTGDLLVRRRRRCRGSYLASPLSLSPPRSPHSGHFCPCPRAKRRTTIRSRRAFYPS